MMKAILKEAEMRRNYISEKINTVYFGGGTPSICSTEEIKCLINTVKELYILDSNAEITLEANPDDIIPDKLAQWKESGINRLSIGIQSFVEEDLRWMNRAHSADQALNCVQTAMKHGFNNITIDLIYGTPTLSDSQWQQNVQTALSLKIPHLSCYALTVEPKTALAGMILQKKTANVDPEKQARHFELLMQWMEDAGYEHYEISNFAKQGYRSQHNSSYWNGSHYLGLGPSAHSFNGISREWNIANNALYINNIEQNILPAETEILTAAQQLNEYIMTSLRTSEGLSLLYTENQWGNEKTSTISRSSEKWLASGLLVCEKNFLFLTKKGKLLADGIASDLFQL